jgi:hypothetical protein
VGTWRTVHEEPDSPSVLLVLREFLRVFRSIFLSVDFLLHEVCGWCVLECRTVRDGVDDPRAHDGQSVIEGAVLEVRVSFSDGPLQPRGQFA